MSHYSLCTSHPHNRTIESLERGDLTGPKKFTRINLISHKKNIGTEPFSRVHRPAACAQTPAQVLKKSIIVSSDRHARTRRILPPIQISEIIKKKKIQISEGPQLQTAERKINSSEQQHPRPQARRSPQPWTTRGQHSRRRRRWTRSPSPSPHRSRRRRR